MTPRLFVTADARDPDRALLDAAGARHLRALHLRRGDRFHAIVGPRREREAAIERLGRDGAECSLGAALPDRGADPTVPRVLAVAVADLARLDLVVEKATELGASAIATFFAARSQLRAVPAARVERWERIARAASEQCGRTIPPAVPAPAPFASLLAGVATPALLVCAPGSPGAPRSLAAGSGALAAGCTLVVGPEGGLTGEETAALAARGAIAIGLGPRILRVETAAIAALATISAWAEGAGLPGVARDHLE